MPRAEVITSAKNPLLKEVRRAISRGERTDVGLCVAESFHLLEEALRTGLEIPTVLTASSVHDVVARRVSNLRGVRLINVADAVFQEISSTEVTQGVIALVRPPEWTLEHVLRGISMLVVLDGVQDPGNAGTLARSAEAFGATGLVFLRGSVSPWNTKTMRAAAGSLFRMPFLDSFDPVILRAALQQRRTDVYVAVPRGGVAAGEADLKRRCAIVIGSEGRGVGEEMRGAGLDLHIATTGVESLNAGIAGSILLYEAWRQRTAS